MTLYILTTSPRKYKIPDYQNGHAYLTSHRVCYIAVEEPRKFSVGIDLKEIDRAEYQVGDLVPTSFEYDDDQLTKSRQGFSSRRQRSRYTRSL